MKDLSLNKKESLRMLLPARIENKLRPYLQSSDKVLYSFRGAWGTHVKGNRTSVVNSTLKFLEGAGQWGFPWLIVMDKRILILGRGLLSVDIRDIPLENVKSIDYEQGLLFDALSFYAHSSTEGIKFNSADRKYTCRLSAKIQELMGRSKPMIENTNTTPMIVLKKRFAMGEITEDEYIKMKKLLSE